MRASSTVKHACVAARIGDDAKRGAANMSILASRATKCPAQGGAGSKRRVLGWRVVGRKRDRRRVEEGPRSFFRGSDLEGGRGRRAVPLRLISGRIPNLKLGPLLHLDSRPSGDAPRTRSLAEWCGKGRARLRPRFLNGALVRLLPQTSLRRTGRSRTPETRIGPDTTRSRPVPRSHPRKRGPCSTFRRSLFHFPAVPAPRSGASPILAATPCGLARVLAHGFVASPLLSRSKRRALLRALSQDRASASRVLPC